jgi:Uma2 family endonuclease
MALAKLKEKEYWTVEEYLEFEKTSPIRHEYVDGRLYPMTGEDGQAYGMAGEKKTHNRIALNLAVWLDRHLAESECETFIENVKVRVSPTLFYYPDVIVTCAPRTADDEDEYTAEHPVLLIEVLSKTTARTDRVEKMNQYQHITSLREYVIIAQERMRVEVYRHEQVGADWQSEVYTEPEAEVFFASVGAKIKVADIYRRVKFAAPETEEE